MNIYRITESTCDISTREIYGLLEKLNTFTLLECRDVQKISLNNLTNTIVLDHFDEAKEPSSLLKQLTSSQLNISTLLLVDSDPKFTIPNLTKLNVSAHIIFDFPSDTELKQEANLNKHELLIYMIQRNKEIAA